jgi:hypothetical protein
VKLTPAVAEKSIQEKLLRHSNFATALGVTGDNDKF